MNEQRIIDRLLIYMKDKNLNDNKLTVECQLSVGLIGQAKKGKCDLGKKAIEKILNKYQDINSVWLLTGEGPMLRQVPAAASPVSVPASSAPARDYPPVPLLPFSAMAGPLSDFAEYVDLSRCEKIAPPVKGCDLAVIVAGDSMEPTYPSGCYIFVKKIVEAIFIEWGKVYLLDTMNGSVVKIVEPGEDEAHVLCRSINTNYAPFSVCKEDILGMYRVLASIHMY